MKLVFAHPEKFPVLRLVVLLVLELTAILTSDMGTITLLNKNSDTSEIAVSKFFTNYSQKLSLIVSMKISIQKIKKFPLY